MSSQELEEVELQPLSDLLRSRKRLSETQCRAIGAQILTAWQLSPSTPSPSTPSSPRHSPSARERVVSAAFIIAECATGMTLDRNVHWSMNSLLALGCPAKLARDLAEVFANPNDEKALAKLFAWPKSADGNECPEAVEFESGVVAGLEPLPLVSPPHNVENDPNRWRENSRRSFKELLEIFSIDPHP